MRIDDRFNHHRVENISRGAGRSAIKSAAYITAEKLHDERTGLTHGRAESKGRVIATGTVGPKDSEWDTGTLWSAAEKAETRSNSRVAQSHTLALPNELDETAHKRLLNGFCLWHRDTYGVGATWALHAPDAQGDQRNVHGHILTTTRRVAMGLSSEPVFAEKVREIHGQRESGAAELERQRAEWAKRVNKELERAGSERRLDHRSFERRAAAGDGPEGLEPGTHRPARQSAKERRVRRGAGTPEQRQAAKRARLADADRVNNNRKKQKGWTRKEGEAASVAPVSSAPELAFPSILGVFGQSSSGAELTTPAALMTRPSFAQTRPEKPKDDGGQIPRDTRPIDPRQPDEEEEKDTLQSASRKMVGGLKSVLRIADDFTR